MSNRFTILAAAVLATACATVPGGERQAAATVLIRNHAHEPVVVAVNGRRTATLGLGETVCVGLYGGDRATVSYRRLGLRSQRAVAARTPPAEGSAAWLWALSGHDRDEYAVHPADAPCAPTLFR